MGEISVTIKSGKNFDDTWQAFKGDVHEVREQIIDYFGFDAEAFAELTLDSLVVNATQVAHGKATAASVLGAVVAGEKAEANGVDATPYADQGHPADKGVAEPEPEVDVKAELTEALNGAADQAALKRIYSENTSAIKDDADLAALFKERWKAVK